MRVLVVEDETPARQRLLRLLRLMPALEVVGDCSNGVAALRFLLEAVASCTPVDVLLLDVEIPGLSGVDVLKALANSCPDDLPIIVFVTASGRVNADAFGMLIADHVLKPYSDERLELAVQRALPMVQARRCS